MDKLLDNRILKKNDIRNILLIIIIVTFVVFNIFQIIFGNILEKNGSIYTIMSYYIAGFPLLLLLVELMKTTYFTKKNISLLLMLAYQSIVAIVGIINAKNISEVSLFAKYVSTTTFPIVLYVMGQNNFGKNFINFLFSANTIMSILFIILFFSDKAYKFNGDVGTYPWLTLNFSNPNLTAMILLGNMGVLLLSFNHYQSLPIKTVLIALFVVMLYFLYLTNSRLSFGIGIILGLSVALNFRVKKGHIVVVIFLPIIFFLLYNCLYSIEGLRDVTIMGKPLFSGRIELWQSILMSFNPSISNIFVGNFGLFQLYNAHNGMLTQLVNYGIIGVVLYFYNLYIQISSISQNCKKNRAMNNAMYIILSSVLLMLAESGPVINGGIINFFVLVAVAYIKYAEVGEVLTPKIASNFYNTLLER